MSPVIAKILRTFFTSLVLFYCKKLVYYIDIFFSDVFSDEPLATCNHCNYKFRVDIVAKQFDNCCPNCGSSSYTKIAKKETTSPRDKILKGVKKQDGREPNFKYKFNRSDYPSGSSTGPGPIDFDRKAVKINNDFN